MTTLNNRTLAIILVALVAVYIGARIIRVPQREGALAMALLHIDTAAVRQVSLYPYQDSGKEIKIVRAASGWQVDHGGVTAEADSNAVKGLLGSFIGMEASRVVTEQSAKWDEYKVGDTSGTRVVVMGDGGSPLGEWWVGEAPPQGGMYGGGQSYVRMAGQDKVYVVEGYLHSQYNKGFNEWRNTAFLRLDKNSISGATASGAQSWVLERDSTAWLLAGMKADSAAVERYIGRFSSMDFSEFADGFTPPSEAEASLVLHSSVGDLARIQAWRTTDSTWTLQSSQRPQVYFKADHKRFSEEILPPVSTLAGD